MVRGSNCFQKNHISQTTSESKWLERLLNTRRNMHLLNFFEKVNMEEKDPGDVKGTKLKILKYPHPQLRAENEEVTQFDESLADKARQMLLVMYAADGIGLAAPQVGINQKFGTVNLIGILRKDFNSVLFGSV